MNSALRAAYVAELTAAEAATVEGNAESAFHHLGRAHILSQRCTAQHVHVLPRHERRPIRSANGSSEACRYSQSFDMPSRVAASVMSRFRASWPDTSDGLSAAGAVRRVHATARAASSSPMSWGSSGPHHLDCPDWRNGPPAGDADPGGETMTLPLHERVVLTQDLPKDGLRAGDVGVIVEVYPARADLPEGYELEVFAANGQTVAVVSVPASAVREATEHEVLSVREMART
jgi:hypothetical protein